MPQVNTVVRAVFCLFGISGFGIIVAEILKKWQIISRELELAWIIGPMLLLFLCREASHCAFIKANDKVPAHLMIILERTVNVIFIIISIIVCIGIPFLWFGTIEELGKGGRM